MFNVEERTGVVITKVELDRELTDEHVIQVLAEDGGQPKKTATQDIVVTVLDVNDNAPILDKTMYEANVEATAPALYRILHIFAMDPDLEENGTVTFLLKKYSDVFQLVYETGELLLKRSPKPGEVFYSLAFTASDSGNPERKTESVIYVKIVSENKYSPVFVNDYTFDLLENAPIGTVIGRVQATDYDSGSAGSLTFYSDNPYITVQEDGVVLSKAILDSEQVSEVSFTAFVRDDGSYPTGPLTATTTVTVNIVDVNDNAPSFSLKELSVNVAEDIEIRTEIAIILLEDEDEGENGVISSVQIFAKETGPLPFTVFLQNNTVTLYAEPELDREVKDRYYFDIVVTDSGLPSMNGSISIEVLISDINDNPPKFIDSQVELQFPYDTVINALLYEFRIEDADQNDMIRFHLTTDPETAVFALSTLTGKLRLNQTIDVSNSPDTYQLIVSADDGVHRTDLPVSVRFTNENLFAPVFARTAYAVNVTEDVAVYELVLVVTATDSDSSTVTYSIAEGDTNNVFSMDSLTGEIRIQRELDYEMISEYNLVVVASDGGYDGNNIKSAQVDVKVSVIDVNEFAPQFVPPITEDVVYFVKEDCDVGTVINKFSAIDGDGHAIVYSILPVDETDLQIDGATGVLSTTAALDRERRASYDISIAATDQGNPPKSAIYSVRITVEDVNDNAPIFCDPVTVLIVPRADIVPGSVIHTFFATDADEGDNGVVGFSVEPASDLVRINEDTGELVALLDGENMPAIFDIVIVVKDKGQPPQNTSLGVELRFIPEVQSTSVTTSASTSKISSFQELNTPLSSTSMSLSSSFGEPSMTATSIERTYSYGVSTQTSLATTTAQPGSSTETPPLSSVYTVTTSYTTERSAGNRGMSLPFFKILVPALLTMLMI